MSLTYTRSQTSTMTEARVRAVMLKVTANLNALVVNGLITRERADWWERDLTYLQYQDALDYFELQFRSQGKTPYGLRYTVSRDGRLLTDQRSGGLELYGIPRGTQVSIVVNLLPDARQAVYDEMGRRGWGTSGVALNGTHAAHRTFSNEGYGVTRAHVGEWPE